MHVVPSWLRNISRRAVGRVRASPQVTHDPYHDVYTERTAAYVVQLYVVLRLESRRSLVLDAHAPHRIDQTLFWIIVLT